MRKGTVKESERPLVNNGNSHRSREPRIHCICGDPNLYLDQPIMQPTTCPTECYVSYPTDIVSGNGLSPFRSQAITWTNAGLMSVGFLGTSFSEIWIGILSFPYKKMHLKMSSAKMASVLSNWDGLKLHATMWNIFFMKQQEYSVFV